MKDLTILNEGILNLQSQAFPDLTLIECTFDAVHDSMICIMADDARDVFEVQRLGKNGDHQILCYFESPCPGSDLISFRHFEDCDAMVFILSNGDVVMGKPDFEASDGFSVEIAGLIDANISAAQWSPDGEILVIISSSLKMHLVSRSFEPIFDTQLSEEDTSKVAGTNVSVGWGRKETQFRGKGFKALERERETLKHAGLDLIESSILHDPTVKEEESGRLSLYDDNSVRIAWRDDCEVFAVSSRLSERDCSSRRAIRFYSRFGELEAVSGAVDGLDCDIHWRSLSTLLTASVSSIREYDQEDEKLSKVIFFERNGLRHGEFERESEIVKQIAWSCNGEVLALVLHDRVQFWTTKNYHWYLKQECFIEGDGPSSLTFHPDKPLTIMTITAPNTVKVITLGITVNSGPSVKGFDGGIVCVTDGHRVNMTPLGISNVPPPLCLLELNHKDPVRSFAFSDTQKMLVTLTSRLEFYLNTNIHFEDDSVQLLKQLKLSTNFIKCAVSPKQVCLTNLCNLFVLSDGHSFSLIHIFSLPTGELRSEIRLPLKGAILKPLVDEKIAVVELIDGRVLEVDEGGDLKELCSFPQFCSQVEAIVTRDGGRIVVGLSESGKIFGGPRLIASSITSFKLTDQFLCITSAQSKLHFIHLSTMDHADLSYIGFTSIDDERTRPIERGALLVTVVPTKYAVILQAPRGNLETIYPRIMVLTAVRSFIKELRYYDAYIACRAHRIDLDILYDYDVERFENNIAHFIEQIKRVDYLDLFVSNLHEGDVTRDKYSETLQSRGDHGHTTAPQCPTSNEKKKASKVNRICNLMLEELAQDKYGGMYLQVQITAFACQKPPNDDGALQLIAAIADELSKDEAITHLCYLQDASHLYKRALGLFDPKLALCVAQRSQMDPKEYLPFLQRLHGELEFKKRFIIDDYLGKRESALRWLYELGDEFKLEFIDYVVKHSVYATALRLIKHDFDRRNQVLMLYAEYLGKTSYFEEAGRIFESLGANHEALVNYIAARCWKEALSLAKEIHQDEKVKEIARTLSRQLEECHNYRDSAIIESSFLNDDLRAIRLYCKAYEFDSAILLTKVSKLDDNIVDMELRESFGMMIELLADCTSQLASQVSRLREIRKRKALDPTLFYDLTNTEIETPDDVSIAESELSTTPSFFTKYTGKTEGTAKTGASRRTLKNKRREERKRAKGRKGTVYEEEYLIQSVGRMIERLNSTVDDATHLVQGLVRRKMWEEAYQIRTSWDKLTEELAERVEEVFTLSEKDRERIGENGEVYLIPELVSPMIVQFPVIKSLNY